VSGLHVCVRMCCVPVRLPPCLRTDPTATTPFPQLPSLPQDLELVYVCWDVLYMGGLGDVTCRPLLERHELLKGVVRDAPPEGELPRVLVRVLVVVHGSGCLRGTSEGMEVPAHFTAQAVLHPFTVPAAHTCQPTSLCLLPLPAPTPVYPPLQASLWHGRQPTQQQRQQQLDPQPAAASAISAAAAVPSTAA